MNLKKIEKFSQRVHFNFFKGKRGNILGAYRGFFRGQGIQFKEHKEYCYGDDPRFIDWKVWAKTLRPFIKTFEEERNREIFVIIDAGSTMFYGDNGIAKIAVAAEICGLLMLLAQKNKDRIHPILLHEKVHFLTGPNHLVESKGPAALFYQLKKLGLVDKDEKWKQFFSLKEVAEKEVDHLVSSLLREKKDVFVISDFLSLTNKSSLLHWFAYDHFYCCHVQAELDELETLPFLMLGHQQKRVYFKQEQNYFKKVSEKYHKRVINLKVSEDYLYYFMKGLIGE